MANVGRFKPWPMAKVYGLPVKPNRGDFTRRTYRILRADFIARHTRRIAGGQP